MSTTARKLPSEADLKREVLEEQLETLCLIGDPSRYFPKLRSVRVLSREDCELIRHEVTSKDKVLKFVDLLLEGRQGKYGRHAFDVLVDVLIHLSVHASVARQLQMALAKKREELDLEIESLSECVYVVFVF